MVFLIIGIALYVAIACLMLGIFGKAYAKHVPSEWWEIFDILAVVIGAALWPAVWLICLGMHCVDDK